MPKAIIWTNIEQVLWCYMASLSHNGERVYTWVASVYHVRCSSYTLGSEMRHLHEISSLQWRHNGRDASQITSITIVYLTAYSVTDKKTHQSSASLAFVRGIHQWPVNSPREFPAQRASNKDNVSIWWHHHISLSFHQWVRAHRCVMNILSC